MSANYRGSGKHGTRPAGLRGKEIGLYYKNLHHKRKQEGSDGTPKIHLGPSVSAPPQIRNQVVEYLQNFEQQTQQEGRKVCREFEQRFQDLLTTNFTEFIAEAKRYDEKSCSDSEKSRTIELSEQLKSHLSLQEQTEEFRRRYVERSKLPAMQQHQNIINAIERNQVTLIVGSTGCGKTTQVPQLLLDECIRKGRGADCRIVCTQPRRISAISVAERVASERCEQLGSSVGYQIRLESSMPREYGSILYCTTGILLTKMQSDPLMRNVDYVILDEIHERSVQTDLLMALLKLILPLRPELKLILMSATVSEETFCGYFNNCCTLRIDGTLFPVQMLYLEDILQETGFRPFATNEEQKNKKKSKPNWRNHRNGDVRNKREYEMLIEPYLHEIRHNYDAHVCQTLLQCPDSEGCANLKFLEFLIFHICENKPEGAILVFLPGYDKISKLSAALQESSLPIGRRNCGNLQIYPLHSLMPTQHQQSVFKPAPAGKRKVILSTIIAETSVTIDDVVYVINTGRTKISDYNVESNIQTLEEVWVTKANSMQRRGRAGRVRAGICYNLFTRARENTMADVPTPEILRCKLESIILDLKLLHIKDESEFLSTLIDAPNPEAIQNGIHLLKRINALDGQGALTPLGMHLAHLPIDPQMGKMILMASLFRCLDPITSVAAGISYKSPFYVPLGEERRVDSIRKEMSENTRSDHLLFNNVILNYRAAVNSRSERSFCRTNFLSLATLQQLENMKQQFASILRSASFVESGNCADKRSNANSNNVPLLRAIIAAGLYPNMAHLRKVRQIRNRVQAIHSISTPENRRINFHPSSVNNGVSSFDSNYFVYFQKQKSGDLYMLDATMVYPMALLIFGDNVETGVTPEHQFYISVAKSYFFKCDKETADVIITLRNHMEWLLQKKALYPSVIATNSSDEYLLRAIQILLSLDDMSDMEDEYLSSDD